jgi:putative transposase
VKVYAYCLMMNHVHLLLAPGESTAELGRLMKALAARATRYRNRLEGRSGTLWESRYKSSVVQSDSYLLACSRYIELNPVRARMVADVADYAWSSYRSRVGDESGGCWLDADPCFLALGDTAMERRLRYEELVRQAIPTDQLRLIRDALQRGQLTGTSRFVDEVERIVGVRVEQRGQGRPRAESGK